MRKFYEAYRDISNLPIILANLPWSFNCLLLDKVEDIVKRIWYAKECLNNGLSQIPTNTEDRSLKTLHKIRRIVHKSEGKIKNHPDCVRIGRGFHHCSKIKNYTE